MSFSNTITPPSFPLPPANKPKGLSFTIPYINRWNFYSKISPSNDSCDMRWIEKGKSITDSDCISYLGHIMPGISLAFYCECTLTKFQTLSHRGISICPRFRNDACLVKWVAQDGGSLYYLFSLILGLDPYFFVLQYRTRSELKYNSESGIYLEMLHNAKIVDIPPPNSN